MKTLSKYLVALFALSLVVTGVQAEELTRQQLGKGGTSLDTTAVDAGSDTYLNDDRTVLVVSSDTTATTTVTITAQKTNYQSPGFGPITFSDISVDVANGDSYVRAPLAIYNNDNGRVEVSYSGDTSAVNVAVFRRPQD